MRSPYLLVSEFFNSVSNLILGRKTNSDGLEFIASLVGVKFRRTETSKPTVTTELHVVNTGFKISQRNF